MNEKDNAALQSGESKHFAISDCNRFAGDCNSVVDGFRDAMRDAGIAYSGVIIPDGKLHRFHIDGRKSGTKDGAYRLYLDDFPGGWFQSFASGIKGSWAWRKDVAMPQEVIRQRKENDRQREIQTRQKQAAASERAIRRWNKATPVKRKSQHNYLIEKNILPYGVRLWKGHLIIPLFDENFALCSLQIIDSKGNKRFMADGRKRGCFFIIGDESASKTLICEGYATGASLHQHTGDRVVVAFDAGNLLPVAQAIRGMWEGEIIVCGDNDASGAGQEAANKAAFTIGAKVSIPPTKNTDWNDVISGDSE